MTTQRRPWSIEEQLVVLRYYLQTDFGRLHSSNPEIVGIAEALGRSPSSIAMKGSNYASMDPNITGTGRRGLGSVSRQDTETWQLMLNSFDEFESRSADAAHGFGIDPATMSPLSSSAGDTGEEILPGHSTERQAEITVRRGQSFFRKAVLAAYGNSCSLTGIRVPELLVASHIIPWRTAEHLRLDPRNGIALNALHDRAFDVGLISFEDDLTVLTSSELTKISNNPKARKLLQDFEGSRGRRPIRFAPDRQALEYHRDTIFRP